MKGIKMAILIFSGVLCIAALLWFALSLNKVTIFLDYQINVDDVQEMEIMGISIPPDTGNHRYVYTDKQKTQKIISYLNSFPLVEANRKELPNMSPDVTIQFSDENEETIGVIWIYGQVFIEDRLNGTLYRSKTRQVIEGLENLGIITSDKR